MIGRLPPIARQFMLFLGVGAINTLAALALILVLSQVFDVYYVLANFLGYVFGVCLGFVLHRSITFRNAADRKFIRLEFMQFLMVFAGAYTLQLIALVMLVQFMGIMEWVSQVLAIGVYTAANFLGNRLFTFRHKGETGA